MSKQEPNPTVAHHRSGPTLNGHRWLRQTLTQAARAASHTKRAYLSAQNHRLSARRGKERAVAAWGHTFLIIIHHLLKHGTTHSELGVHYPDRPEPERLTRQLVRRLEQLEHQVTLEPHDEAA